MLANREKSLKAEHPHTIATTHILADVRMAMTHYYEAHKLYHGRFLCASHQIVAMTTAEPEAAANQVVTIAAKLTRRRRLNARTKDTSAGEHCTTTQLPAKVRDTGSIGSTC